MKKFLILALLCATPGWAADITVRPSTNPAAETYIVKFTTGHAVNTITDPIPACMGGMKVFFTQGVTGQVTLYPAGDADNTFAELEANTPLKVFTGTDYVSLSGDDLTEKNVRFVVDFAETGAASEAKIQCSNVARGGGIGPDDPLLTTGTIGGATYMEAFNTGDPETMTQEQLLGGYYTVGADTLFELPAVATLVSGSQACWRVTVAQTATLCPHEDDRIFFGGGLLAVDRCIVSSGVTPDRMCLIRLLNGVGWITQSDESNWSDGGVLP